MTKSPLQFILLACTLRGALFLSAMPALVQPCAGGGFEATGSLVTARDAHTATLLSNGIVLVAGGYDNSSATATAELFDPASGTWTETNSLAAARYFHTATLLPGGTALVAGGLGNNGTAAIAELYDPASGTWTDSGSLATATYYHTATLLPNGMVLVAGGFDNSNVVARAELYDPASGAWTDTGSLATPRASHTATLLPNGMVLVAGGFDNMGTVVGSAELYDPVSGTWKDTGSLTTARDYHTATLLPDGMVLVAGGLGNSFSAVASAELYDPASGTWTDTGSLATARYYHTTTLFPDGTVLAVGGFDNSSSAASAELYDPTSGTWTDAGSLATARYYHTTTLLPDGTVLVAGGFDNSNAVASSELYVTAPPVIFSPLAATGTVDLRFVYQFEASGATDLFVDPAGLPPGLSFDPALSAIVGNPTSAVDSFQVVLSATNAAGTTNATLILTTQPFPTSGPVILSSTAATGRTGAFFRFQVITSGASSAARLSTDTLPPGLSVDPVSGIISGTPTTDGSYLVPLTVSDGALRAAATLQLTFTSDPGVPVITSSSQAALISGQDFSYTIVAPSNADPGTNPTATNLLGTLPLGLGFDPAADLISGVFQARFGLQPGPQLSGGVVTNVQLFATNSNGTSTIPLVFFLSPSGVVNISTRLAVGTADNVLIGGFIITGNAPKKVLIRAIGPSLPVAGALQDTTLELHDGSGLLLGTNDNWRETQEQEIIDTTIPPINNLESAIVAILDPGAYTAIVKGKNNSTGVGLVEVYDLGTASFDIASQAQLVNISTRALVQTGDNVMIGGFIVSGSAPVNVLVRAIGPELTAKGVAGALQDTTLELHDSNGVLLASNDDWQSDQEQEIIDTTVPPTDPRESAIVRTLATGAYTAIVQGKNGTNGVGLVEVYVLP